MLPIIHKNFKKYRILVEMTQFVIVRGRGFDHHSGLTFEGTDMVNGFFVWLFICISKARMDCVYV